jgi:hypothetical protein
MIGIITDSTCDIPNPLLEQFGIIVVPSIVTWGSDQYRDRIDLAPDDFYRRLEADPQQPHSSLCPLYGISPLHMTAPSSRGRCSGSFDGQQRDEWHLPTGENSGKRMCSSSRSH